MENLKTLLKWDDLGVYLPLFLETPRCFETCVFAWNFQEKFLETFREKSENQKTNKGCVVVKGVRLSCLLFGEGESKDD